MEFKNILFAVADGVARLTLNRPDKLNSFTGEMHAELRAALDAVQADKTIRVLVLTGAGEAFCAGGDYKDTFEPGFAQSAAQWRARVRRGPNRFVTLMQGCEKPVIAAVGGTAAGIGAHLALACDLVIAADGVRFIEVFVRRGLVPDGGGAYLLPRLVGVQKAKELLFFGEDLPAADAHALGLVNRVVPADELEAAVDEWAGRLAVAPTRALALTKALVNRSLDSDRATAFAEEANAQEMNMSTADANEGVAAFVERRSPTYRGW